MADITLDDREFKANTDNPGIRANYKPNEEEEKLLQRSYRRYHEMRIARAPEESLWIKWEKQYEAWRPPRNSDDWHSNFVPPYTTSIVEAELAEMVDQTVRPVVTAATSEDKPKATILNFTNDYIWENTSGDLELFKAMKDGLINGTCIVQEYYLYESREVDILTHFDPEKGIEKYEKKKIVDFDNLYFEAVKIQDFFLDPDGRSINLGSHRANDCMRRYIMHIDNFKRVFSGPIWNPLNNAQYVLPGGDTNYWEFYKPPEGIDKSNHVEVMWWWIRHPDKLIIFANDVIIRNGPNPYNHKLLPFASGPDVMRGHQFYHKGEPALLEDIQDELTLNRRMRMDRQHVTINPMWKVAKKADLSQNDLIVAPNKPIFLDDIATDLGELKVSDTPVSAYKEEELIKQDGTRVTGVDPELQAVQKAESATQSAILKEATLKRLRLKIWLLSRTLLYELAILRIPNIIQFYSEPTIEKIVGDKNTQKYINRVASAIVDGRLINSADGLKEKRFREIRTINKELLFTKDGGVQVRAKRGENFFMIRPEMLTPTATSFDYRIKAEPTFPVSKPLLQQKVNELFQHPVMQTALEAGLLDLGKVTKEMLEVNDFDEEDFLAEAQLAEKSGQMIDPEVLLELASRENEIMANGEEKAGTPYSTPEHTQIHIDYMSSEGFREKLTSLDQSQRVNIIRIFSKHILEEEAAQKLRAGAMGATPPPVSGGQGAENMMAGFAPQANELQATLPAMVQGNEMVGNFMQPSQSI